MHSKQCDADAAPLPPKHWPHEEATYTDRNVYDGPPKTVVGLPGVTPRRIDDPRHPCHGAFGLFAKRAWQPFEVVGEYVGRVRPPDVEGHYVLALESDVPHLESLSIDAASMGNELRFVNDFRGVGHEPNVTFQSCTIASRPAQVLVVTKPVPTGGEFLTDYGVDYWKATVGFVPAPAPAPPPHKRGGGRRRPSSASRPTTRSASRASSCASRASPDFFSVVCTWPKRGLRDRMPVPPPAALTRRVVMWRMKNLNRAGALDRAPNNTSLLVVLRLLGVREAAPELAEALADAAEGQVGVLCGYRAVSGRQSHSSTASRQRPGRRRLAEGAGALPRLSPWGASPSRRA